jgi:hypothetical protein
VTATRLGAGTAAFGFAADEDDATFACSVDRSAWTACESPLRLTKLRPGSHEFRVRATDSARNTDWTYGTRTWRFVNGAAGPVVIGSNASELLVGTSGGDTLRGGGGADLLQGRTGDDLLDGGTGVDRFAGGPGRDRLYARDRVRDVVDGGPNHDRAWLDRRLDVASAVEKRL